jgi:hypothetical protein
MPVFRTVVIAAAAWLVPAAAFAIDAPPLNDSPFFGWLAVPVIGFAGHKFLKQKRRRDDNGRP